MKRLRASETWNTNNKNLLININNDLYFLKTAAITAVLIWKPDWYMQAKNRPLTREVAMAERKRRTHQK